MCNDVLLELSPFVFRSSELTFEDLHWLILVDGHAVNVSRTVENVGNTMLQVGSCRQHSVTWSNIL